MENIVGGYKILRTDLVDEYNVALVQGVDDVRENRKQCDLGEMTAPIR